MNKTLSSENNDVSYSSANMGGQQKSWWISFVFHMTILLAIFLHFEHQKNGPTATQEPIRPASIVLAEITASQTTQYKDSDDILKTENPDPEPLDPAEQLNEPEPALTIDKLIDNPFQGNVPGSTDFDAQAAGKVPSNQRSAKAEFVLSDDDLKAIAEEQAAIAARQPVGKPVKASVFDSGEMEGHKWVFVIDRSKSMGNEGLGVLDRAANELANAVKAMGENHSFQVVAYNHKTVVIDHRKLLVASDDNKKKVFSFVYDLAATGGTEHYSALIAGLSFKPDVLILLTDGGFPEIPSGKLKQLNRMAARTTKITCIQFGAVNQPSEGKFMETLAKQNGGVYKYIDVRKWK